MIILAPMEGLLDCVLRDVLTRIGGVDRCVSEFIRVTNTLLPQRAFIRVVPELLNGGRTPSGIPVRGTSGRYGMRWCGSKFWLSSQAS